MDDRTRHIDIERSMKRALSEFSVDFRVTHWMPGETAMVEIGRHGFSASYRMAWLPHPTLSEVARLDGYDRSHRLLVAGPRINSRTADSLREAHIDFADQAGNAHLEFGPVLIDIRGRRNHDTRSSHPAADANLFSTKRMQVLFVLLTWPNIADMSVRAIANAAGTSVGIAQSTLDIMKEADYLLGRSLQHRDELLDLWSAAFRGSLLSKIRTASFEGDIRGWAPPRDYFVSGESAVEDIRQPQTLTIYVERFDPMEAVRSGWRKTNEPNIDIRRKFWNEPRGATLHNRSAVFRESAAPPLLVYADLITSKEPRQSEVARALRREHLV
ncbi:type IV toxin-antitoxin system AbiEi family antitoxin [Nocardia brasiliensis]|uniref:type IV toxin-antitoxin system AbiEi family antitoxin n=1 Tax=Nocardia brasiliensis TaxID=37326 RepID=UPI0024554FC1|nr:type IV toxin-antitoxin system AbiEi family antitoxin [Nocardia brasiliensis]